MKVLCVDTLATRLDILLADLSFRREIKSHQFWTIPHNPGESMAKLSDFLLTENIQVDKLALALPGSLCSYHNFSVPFRKDKDIRQNVPFEIEERVPFDPENIYHAYQVLAKGKVSSDIFATIIPKDLYHRFIDQIRENHLEPDVITPGPVAMAYSLLPVSRVLPDPIMAIEIRDITTYIVVCLGPLILVCRAYPMGLNHFVNPHARFKGVSQEEAYSELKSLGPQFPPGEIPDDLRDIIKPFFVEIKKTIMNVRSQGNNYISSIYLSGYATDWASFEELMNHEFQIPVDRYFLAEKYKGSAETPSLITNGLLQVFANPKSSGLINLRIHEHRAKQSIDEVLKKLETPQNQTLIRYSVATLLLIFGYFIFINIFLSAQKSKLETKLKETTKKMRTDLPDFQQTAKNKMISESSAIIKLLEDKLNTQRAEVEVLRGANTVSTLEMLKTFVERAPYDLKSDIVSLSLKDRTLEVKGNLWEGSLEQFQSRLMKSGKVASIENAKIDGQKFTLGVKYE